MRSLAPDDEDPPNSCGVRGDPPQRSERDLRAWRRTIDHLRERGLTPLGVPDDVITALDALSDPFSDSLSDDHLRRILDLWGQA
jgi:hypothetical protein